ncbi:MULTISPECIES: acyltransferase family protein [Clostridium]|jgi:fucose 4-O-acetylase-like acetyltransferase|uniref:Acyltransferase family protein n=1 Tax=Clostridium lapidicellarium TaxID=3240931 RepID=A0ABV4DW59_9CLOT|nr:acyltransferase [uncultured Clostridium sp.]
MIKKYYKDMDIARGIGIFLVVLGHSFPDSQFNNSNFYAYIYKLIYSFHMPFFFIISGFFAYKIYEIENLKGYGSYVYKKIKRLMVPYFTVSLVAVPIKLYMNNFAARPVKLNSLIINILFYPLDIPIQYFWFIYTLFFIFVAAPIFSKIPVRMALLITLVLNLVFTKQVGLFYIYGIIHYLFYFFFGIYLRTVYDKWNNIENRNKYIVITVFSLFLITLNIFDVRKAIYPYYNLLTALLGSSIFLLVSQLMVNSSMGELFRRLGRYSYDVYLLSWFFQTGARVLFYQMFKFNYSVVIVIMLFIGFMPILMSKLIFDRIPVLGKIFLGRK